MAVFTSSWADVRPNLRSVSLRNVTSRLLKLVDHWVSVADEAEAKFLVCQYSYQDWVIENGIPRMPNGGEFPTTYLVGNQLPFGIVQQNRLEVSEYVPVVGGKVVEVAQDSLEPGNVIGLFEARDWLREPRTITPVDWRISAGSRLASPISSIRVKKLTDLALKRFGIPIQGDNIIESLKRMGREVLNYPKQKLYIQPWVAKVVFFPAIIIDRLNKIASDIEREEWLDALREIKEWQMDRQARRNSGIVRNYFAEYASHYKAGVDAAIRLSDQFTQVLDGSSPCFQIMPEYSATERLHQFEQFGPFAQINSILAECGRAGIAIPMPLNPGDVGFLPFTYSTAAHLAGDSAHETVATVFQLIKKLSEKRLSAPPRVVSDLLDRFETSISYRTSRSTDAKYLLGSKKNLSEADFFKLADGQSAKVDGQAQMSFFDKVLYRIARPEII